MLSLFSYVFWVVFFAEDMALTLPKFDCLADSRFVTGAQNAGYEPAISGLNKLPKLHRNHFIGIRLVYGGNAT